MAQNVTFGLCIPMGESTTDWLCEVRVDGQPVGNIEYWSDDGVWTPDSDVIETFGRDFEASGNVNYVKREMRGAAVEREQKRVDREQKRAACRVECMTMAEGFRQGYAAVRWHSPTGARYGWLLSSGRKWAKVRVPTPDGSRVRKALLEDIDVIAEPITGKPAPKGRKSRKAAA